MVIRNKLFNARVAAAGIALGVLGGASVIAADQPEMGAAAGAGLLPPNARIQNDRGTGRRGRCQ
jgi:hypothetical protein